jgi:hypothetical protein
MFFCVFAAKSHRAVTSMCDVIERLRTNVVRVPSPGFG